MVVLPLVRLRADGLALEQQSAAAGRFAVITDSWELKLATMAMRTTTMDAVVLARSNLVGFVTMLFHLRSAAVFVGMESLLEQKFAMMATPLMETVAALRVQSKQDSLAAADRRLLLLSAMAFVEMASVVDQKAVMIRISMQAMVVVRHALSKLDGSALAL